ncbi:NADPH:adrenodoxin oxidoreductase [Spatholobus suberectus]|nr:NADPH:adrenodoxin oxidoreductase [Spatholobus suberectus]
MKQNAVAERKTRFRAAASLLESDVEINCLAIVFKTQKTASHVSGVLFEKIVLEDVSPNKQFAIGTGEFEDIKCGMVLKSISCKSVPVDGLPFDHKEGAHSRVYDGYLSGIVPKVSGRVLSDPSDPSVVEKGLYICGSQTGPLGPARIVEINRLCAEVSSICKDFLNKGRFISSSALPKPGREGLLQLLHDRNVRIVSFSDWEKIESEERRHGSSRNKPREKLTA